MHQRSLPRQLLKPYYVEHPDFEAQQLQKKFSDPRAVIGENSIDYLFFILMNEDALLYWLPRLFSYLQSEAPRDTFHFEVIMMNLSKRELSSALRSRVSDGERQVFYEFLRWMEIGTPLTTSPPDRAEEYQLCLTYWGP
jgi:hypothetical protein